MSDAIELFLENLPLIERTIASVCRKCGMRAEEIEDFSQHAKLQMIDDDYAIIRAWQKRSTLATYVAAVTQRLLLDQRRHDWGKWRPSAEAERQGDLALELERLLYRDGHTFEEAFQLLAQRHDGVTRHEVSRLAAVIPPRTRRQIVDVDEARLTSAAQTVPDVACTEIAVRVSAVVRTIIDSRPEDDQTLLRLRFECDMTVSQIARALNRQQQQLYPRFYSIFGDLKKELALAGITWSDVAELIGSDTGILDFNLKNRGTRTSEDSGSTVAEPEEDS